MDVDYNPGEEKKEKKVVNKTRFGWALNSLV